MTEVIRPPSQDKPGEKQTVTVLHLEVAPRPGDRGAKIIARAQMNPDGALQGNAAAA